MPRHAASATGPAVGGRSSASHGANVARRPSLAAPAACRSNGAKRGEHPLLAQRSGRRELVVDEPLQRALEPGAQLFALRRPAGRAIDRAAAAAPRAAARAARSRCRRRAAACAGSTRSARIVAGDASDAATRGLTIQIVRLVDDVGRGDAVGQHRQLPREPRVECVECIDAQPLRLSEHLPIERAVAGDDGARELECGSLVRLARSAASSAAARSARSTRRRISAAALRVNVIATTCSGCCTVASNAR